MPRLSDSMEEGTILRWLAADGDRISRGQELAEIETDKASMVYEADEEGVLHILAQQGETLPVGAPIAQLLAEGEQPSHTAAEATAAGNGGGAAITYTGGKSAVAPPPEPEPAAPTHGERVKASPLARRLAQEAGIELSGVAGSGPGGRVVRADVERAAEAAPAPVPAAAAAQAKGQAQTVQLTRTQSLIARRMAEAKATIPEFTLQRVIEMDAAAQLRAQLKTVIEHEESALRIVPSFNDLVVRACALALRKHPRANGSYRDGAFELHERVNVGMAVATDDALLVPVLRDADRRSIWEIAQESRRLAAAVRDGSITPPELSGGTFSISNLGMYGIDSFTAVINPPQAAILAVGSLAQRPVVRDGAIVAGYTMAVTLACDHRILYGADAARFLGTVAELLEQPAALLA